MPLTVATFNVKDLFPEPRSIFEAKVAWTAEMLHRVDADVVALQEIGPPETLDALSAKSGYEGRVLGTADARGIRCALLSRVPIVHAAVHTSDGIAFPRFVEGDPPPFGARLPLRRGVVHARVLAAGLGEVDVLVAHFKSRRAVPLRDGEGRALWLDTPLGRAESEVRSMVWRSAEALFVRARVDEALASSAGGKVIVAGDLNDVDGSATLGVVSGRAGTQGALASCAEIVPAEARYSILHAGARMALDHLLVTAPLRERLVAARFVNDKLREHPYAPGGGDPPPTVDSDHAPFVARFE